MKEVWTNCGNFWTYELLLLGNYLTFSLFIPAVFLKCTRKLWRRQSIHSCFLCNYIFTFVACPGDKCEYI